MVKEKRNRSGNKEDKFNQKVKVCLSEKQLKKYKEESAKLGWKLSRYLRERIDKNVINISSKTDIEMKIQLRKIGVNINQITRRINAENHKINFNTHLNNLNIFLEEVKKVINKIQI